MKWTLIALVLSANAMAKEPSEQRQQQLSELLAHDCGSCHGLTRKGGLGPSLLPDALLNKSDDFLIMTIANGRKGTPMPPWKDFLTKSEIRWMVKSLR